MVEAEPDGIHEWALPALRDTAEGPLTPAPASIPATPVAENQPLGIVPGDVVEPILECVREEAGALVAYSGYDNTNGSVVRVPYSAENEVGWCFR
jgi:hypothetical protein